MKAFAEKFYKSKQWQKLSRLYLESKHFVCERCGGVATICHHKIYLTPANISNLNISLSFENFEALCQNCHNKEHGYFTKSEHDTKRIVFNSSGGMIGIKENGAAKSFRRAAEKIKAMEI